MGLSWTSKFPRTLRVPGRVIRTSKKLAPAILLPALSTFLFVHPATAQSTGPGVAGPRLLGAPAAGEVAPSAGRLRLELVELGAEVDRAECGAWTAETLGRNPTDGEVRCRYGIHGPGRFGLLSYADVPVYQPTTPMPGTHLVDVTGHAGPADGESYEAWERRMLRTRFGPEARTIHRETELLDPRVGAKVLRLERMLAAEGVPARRRETWRSSERQAWLFQQGRSRPGPLATSTLTSWHAQVDARGRPAGRAVDYDLPVRFLGRFHELADSVGLDSFGPDSNDPWHLYLPRAEDVDPEQIVLLRTLPRVPVVTLATGLPVDRDPPPGGIERLRERVEEFVNAPILKPLRPRAQAPPRAPEPILSVPPSPGPTHRTGRTHLP